MYDQQTQAMFTAKNTRLYSDKGDHVAASDYETADLARQAYMDEGHYCTPIKFEGDEVAFDVYDLGELPTNDLPLGVEALAIWVEYARSHNPIPGITTDIYPAIDGDDLAVHFGGSLPRTSVVGETTLWEKVSA